MSNTVHPMGLGGRRRSERGPVRSAYRYRRTPGALRLCEVVLLCLVFLAVVAGALASRADMPYSTPTVRVRVTQGESIWQLARQHPAVGLSTAQTADLIAEINNLEAGSVAVGSMVSVPAQGSGNTALATR
jgi:hypothetical protein